ncbi:hypothetical protein [Candidatus Palauibacter sp.]|uniref:hypothetical protein n=1 Tax=Candidatus Palauibacter sp. TaxID=3101350 RepID=UPI003D0C067C
MAEHVIFSVENGVSVYFRDPRSPPAARDKRKHRRLAAPNGVAERFIRTVKQECTYLDDFRGPMRPGTYTGRCFDVRSEES